MEFLDMAKKAAGYFGLVFGGNKSEKAKEESKKPEKEEEGFIMRTLRRLGLAKDAEKVQEKAEKERAGIFGEVWESVLARQFPTLSKLMDLASATGVTKKDVQSIPLMNEFESITAFTLFIPDFLLKKVTDPMVKSTLFMSIVEHWPLLDEKWVKELKKPNYDPDDVISVLRIMAQDLVSGKVTGEKMMACVM